jgi:hypothetical protein
MIVGMKIQIATLLGVVWLIQPALAVNIPDRIIDGIAGKVQRQEVIKTFSSSGKSYTSSKIYSTLGYKTDFNYTSVDGVISVYKIELSSLGYPIKETTFVNSRDFYTSNIYNYSLTNKLIDSVNYSPSGAFFAKTDYFYDANNRLIEERTASSIGGIITKNIYDSTGLLLQRSVVYQSTNGNSASTLKSYRNDGLIATEEIEIKMLLVLSKTLYTNEYSSPDGKGNFTQLRTLKSDDSVRNEVYSIAKISTSYFE